MINSEKQREDWEISVVYVNDKVMTKLNKDHLKKNKVTDVISFNLTDEFSQNPEGEIYICTEQAQIQAEEYGVSIGNEITRLTAHGVLHLFGYEDDTDEKRNYMSQLEDKAIAYFENHIF